MRTAAPASASARPAGALCLQGTLKEEEGPPAHPEVGHGDRDRPLGGLVLADAQDCVAVPPDAHPRGKASSLCRGGRFTRSPPTIHLPGKTRQLEHRLGPLE